MVVQSLPDGAHSSKYTSTSPFFDSSKSFIALQKLNDAFPSRTTPVEGAIQIWYFVGSASFAPSSVFFSVSPGESSRPGS
jgi:hypothetical protein